MPLPPHLTLYVLWASLIASPLLDLAGHHGGYRRLPQLLLCSISLLALAITVMPLVSPNPDASWPYVASYGDPEVGACLIIDRASLFLAATTLLLAFFSSLYALGRSLYSPGYVVAFTALLVGMVGVLFSGDLLTLYIFWEMMCLAAYSLVAMGEKEEEALEAAWKYFIMGSIGAVLMLFGISFLYGLAGTLNMALLAGKLGGASDPWLLVALSFFLIGMGIEAAFVPLHTWLPDAHPAAPTPVSAMLSGMVIEVGFYGVLRSLMTLFHGSSVVWRGVVIAVCLANMLLGNLSALTQSDVKRLLAFSSVAHIGYMALGLIASSEAALSAALFLILSHALSKGLAFLCSGSLSEAMGTREISALRGAWRSTPEAVAALTISLLSLMGLPLTSGFAAKISLLSALFSGGFWWLGAIMLANVILGAAAYLRLVSVLLRGDEPGTGVAVERPGRVEVAVLASMSALVIALGLWPSPVLSITSAAAGDLLDTSRYASALGGR